MALSSTVVICRCRPPSDGPQTAQPTGGRAVIGMWRTCPNAFPIHDAHGSGGRFGPRRVRRSQPSDRCMGGPSSTDSPRGTWLLADAPGYELRAGRLLRSAGLLRQAARIIDRWRRSVHLIGDDGATEASIAARLLFEYCQYVQVRLTLQRTHEAKAIRKAPQD
jgi:hypothetical protein